MPSYDLASLILEKTFSIHKIFHRQIREKFMVNTIVTGATAEEDSDKQNYRSP